MMRTATQIKADNARILRVGVGYRGIKSKFGHPNGPMNIPVDTPGLDKAIRLTASGSKNQANGYSRSLIYANKIAGTPGLTPEGLDTPLRSLSGSTDGDILFYDQHKNLRYRVEVKDDNYLPAEKRVRGQIDKMAEDRRATGRRQALMARNKVSQPLKDYAGERGVLVYEEVATGDKSKRKQGANAIEDVIDDMRASEGRLSHSTLAANAPNGSADARARLRFARWSNNTKLSLRLARSRVANTHQLLTAKNLRSGLKNPRILARGALIVVILYELGNASWNGYKWYDGRMTNRELGRSLVTGGATALGGLAGMGAGTVVGAGAGAAIGSIVPVVGTVVGGVVGGVAGGIVGGLVGGTAGSIAADVAASQYFALLDEQEKKQFRNWIYEYYGVADPG